MLFRSVQTAWNSVGGPQGGKNQKGIKDKRGEKKKHVIQQQHLGSHRPNPKPSRKATPIITQGPFSRQWLRGEWLRGESSRIRPNAKPTRKVIQPKPANFKKPLQTSTRGRPKRSGSRTQAQTEELAQAELNKEGFYEVRVQYSHSSRLAKGCGFTVDDVDQALNEDNQQRREEVEKNREMDTEDEGPDLSYDADLQDESESEEDLS